MRKRRSFYDLLAMFPPCRVRLLARARHGAPLSETEIAATASLPIYEVAMLSKLTDWSGVDIETIRKFTHGCGLDLDDPVSVKRKLVYCRGKHYLGSNRIPPSYAYLKRSPLWQTLYKPMIELWTKAKAE